VGPWVGGVCGPIFFGIEEGFNLGNCHMGYGIQGESHGMAKWGKTFKGGPLKN